MSLKDFVTTLVGRGVSSLIVLFLRKTGMITSPASAAGLEAGGLEMNRQPLIQIRLSKCYSEDSLSEKQQPTNWHHGLV
jgi:hypothetical protein